MSTGSEDDVNLMAWSPPTGTVPGDVLVFNNSICSDFGGWELQANLTEVASENVTLPYDWAENTALSSEKIGRGPEHRGSYEHHAHLQVRWGLMGFLGTAIPSGHSQCEHGSWRRLIGHSELRDFPDFPAATRFPSSTL